MTTKILSLAGFAILLFSCSDDTETTYTPPPSNENAVIDHYTVESTNVVDGAEIYRTFVTANLVDEKFLSETTETFVDNVPQGTVMTQHYFYDSNGWLTKREYENDRREFYYDAQGNLIGLTWTRDGVPAYYRFVHLDDAKVFFERTTLPYDDPAAEASNRIVIEFDANDNIIRAGRDADLDGVANWYHTFDYDVNGNLSNVHEYGGGGVAIGYAPIKDTMFKLLRNTYGKKNLLIYQAECYANLTIDEMRFSPDLRMSDTAENLIETQAFPYYFRKTKTTTSADGNSTIVTTFYFE